MAAARPPSAGVGKAQHDTAGARRFLLDLGHHHRANLGGVAHMGAAAGLQVHALDLDQPHPARAVAAARRLHPQAAHQRGLGVELGRADRSLSPRNRQQ